MTGIVLDSPEADPKNKDSSASSLPEGPQEDAPVAWNLGMEVFGVGRKGKQTIKVLIKLAPRWATQLDEGFRLYKCMCGWAGIGALTAAVCHGVLKPCIGASSKDASS